MKEPRWITEDVPRIGEVSVPVRAISAETLRHAQELTSAIVNAIVQHRNWEHLVLEAVVEAERRGQTDAVDSEAPTEITFQPPDARRLEAPPLPTSYSSVGPVLSALDEEIVFALTSDLPREPSE